MKFTDNIVAFVKNKQSDFERISKEYSNRRDKDDVEYTILDYNKIFTEMIDFIKGYVEYKNSGDTKFLGKVVSTCTNFYGAMFSDNKYRKKFILDEFKGIVKDYLVHTKELTTLIDEIGENVEPTDYELKNLLIMTSNQYRKIGKVFSDDMDIYFWLNTAGSQIYNHKISDKLEKDYRNKQTPVIHKA